MELPSVSGSGENQIDKATAHGTTSRRGNYITHFRPVKIPMTNCHVYLAGIRSSAGRGKKVEGPWLTWKVARRVSEAMPLQRSLKTDPELLQHGARVRASCQRQ